MSVTVARAAELVDSATAELAAAGVDAARLNAEWLLAGALGVGRFEIYASTEAFDADLVARYAAMVRRRASGEPLQYVTGWEAFRGLRIAVTDAVLVPRPETETLVEWALALLPPGPARVADVGTGSGCIAAAIAAERPDVCVVALDVDMAAMRIARRNAIEAAVGERVSLAAADVLDAVRSDSLDMVVSNPPYLPRALLEATPREVRDWEPQRALVAGADGLAMLRPLILDARRVLRVGAPLVLETAGNDQANAVARLMHGAGYADTAIRQDLAGIPRFVAARWLAEAVREHRVTRTA